MKNFKLTALIFFILSLNACVVTQDKLWGKKYYNENFKKFAIGDNGEELILFGEKYEYHLTDSADGQYKYGFSKGQIKKIQNILLSEESNKFKLSQSNIRIISSKGELNDGYIWFKIKKDQLSPNGIKLVESLTGSKFKSLRDPVVINANGISGKRYTKDESKYRIYNLNLANKFQDNIYIEYSPLLNTTGKILLTPFAMAADIIMMPITIPYKIYRDIKESKTDHYCQGEFCGYDKLNTNSKN
ncbi:MAG: hypothetical protein K0R25_675 [Rickettsiaceae bacterium]|jgi:hypothetical protein|nr:hypothetical protein [Rickettsiaceae bacterium]